MSAVIGALRVNLGMNSTAFLKGVDEAQRRLAGMQRTFARVGSQLSGVGRAMSVGITAPVVAFGGLALKAGGDFEAAMNRVGAISGATGNGLASLRNAAKEMGATTQFSASQAADALGFLAMAGFDAEQATAALPGTLQLAAAAQMDLAQSADIVSNVLSGYRMGVEDLARVNDVLVKTFTSSNTDLVQLGEAMKYAGPIASAAGVAFEESAAAIGLMGNAGIQASMAGTSLRGAIGRILEPTASASKTMRELGLNFTDAAGKILSFDQIIRQLEPHADDAGLFIELFGQRAGPAMAALVGQGSDALVRLRGELEQAGGTAARISAAQMEGFNGAMKRLASAFEAAQIAIAESGLLEFGTRVADGLAALLSRISEANPALLRIGTIVAGVAAALGPLAVAAGIATLAVGALIPVISAVALPVAAVAAGVGVLWLAMQDGEGVLGRIGEAIRSLPFVSMAAGAVRAVAGFVELVGAAGSFQNALIVLKAVAVEVVGRLGDGWEAVKLKSAAAFEGVKAGAFSALAGLVGGLPGFVNPIIGAFVGAKDAIIAAWGLLPAAVAAIVARAANATIDGVEKAVNKTVDLLNGLLSVIPASARELLGWGDVAHVTIGRVEVAAVGAGAAISGAFGAAFNADYTGPMSAGLQGLSDDARAVSVAAGEAGQAMLDAATAPLSTVEALREAQRMLARDTAAGGQAVSDGLGSADDAGEDLADTLDDVADAGEDVGDRAGGGARKLRDELSAAEQQAKATQDSLMNMGKSFVSDLVSNPADAFSNLVDSFKSAAGEALSNALFSPEGFGAGFSTAWQSLTTGLSGLASGGGFAALGSAISGAMPFIGAAIGIFNLISTFSTTTKIGSGLSLGVTGGNIVGSSFEEFEKTYFWGLFKKTVETTKGLSAAFKSELQAQVDAVKTGIVDIYGSLGIEIPTRVLDSVRFAIQKFSTEGMSEEQIAERIAAIFTQYGDALSVAVGRIGAAAAQTLSGVQAILDPIGKAFDVFEGVIERAGQINLSKVAGAADALATLAGGIDALNQQTGAFYEAFFTDAEKLEVMQRKVSETFAKLGLAIPKTDEEFKGLVLAQDLMTAAGREAYAALIGLAPVFDQVTDATLGAIEKLRAVYSLDATGFVYEWEAKLSEEMRNQDRYSADLITSQNTELARQTALLQEIRAELRRTGEIASDDIFAASMG